MASHPRATTRGQRIVDEAHWDGLPDGHTRAVTTSLEDDHDGKVIPLRRRATAEQSVPGSLQALLTRTAAADVRVEHRPLSVYEQLAGIRPTSTTAPSQTKEHR